MPDGDLGKLSPEDADRYHSEPRPDGPDETTVPPHDGGEEAPQHNDDPTRRADPVDPELVRAPADTGHGTGRVEVYRPEAGVELLTQVGLHLNEWTRRHDGSSRPDLLALVQQAVGAPERPTRRELEFGPLNDRLVRDVLGPSLTGSEFNPVLHDMLNGGRSFFLEGQTAFGKVEQLVVLRAKLGTGEFHRTVPGDDVKVSTEATHRVGTKTTDGFASEFGIGVIASTGMTGKPGTSQGLYFAGGYGFKREAEHGAGRTHALEFSERADHAEFLHDLHVEMDVYPYARSGHYRKYLPDARNLEEHEHTVFDLPGAVRSSVPLDETIPAGGRPRPSIGHVDGSLHDWQQGQDRPRGLSDDAIAHVAPFDAPKLFDALGDLGDGRGGRPVLHPRAMHELRSATTSLPLRRHLPDLLSERGHVVHIAGDAVYSVKISADVVKRELVGIVDGALKPKVTELTTAKIGDGHKAEIGPDAFANVTGVPIEDTQQRPSLMVGDVYDNWRDIERAHAVDVSGEREIPREPSSTSDGERHPSPEGEDNRQYVVRLTPRWTVVPEYRGDRASQHWHTPLHTEVDSPITVRTNRRGLEDLGLAHLVDGQPSVGHETPEREHGPENRHESGADQPERQTSRRFVPDPAVARFAERDFGKLPEPVATKLWSQASRIVERRRPFGLTIGRPGEGMRERDPAYFWAIMQVAQVLHENGDAPDPSEHANAVADQPPMAGTSRPERLPGDDSAQPHAVPPTHSEPAEPVETTRHDQSPHTDADITEDPVSVHSATGSQAHLQPQRSGRLDFHATKAPLEVVAEAELLRESPLTGLDTDGLRLRETATEELPDGSHFEVVDQRGMPLPGVTVTPRRMGGFVVTGHGVGALHFTSTGRFLFRTVELPGADQVVRFEAPTGVAHPRLAERDGLPSGQESAEFVPAEDGGLVVRTPVRDGGGVARAQWHFDTEGRLRRAEQPLTGDQLGVLSGMSLRVEHDPAGGVTRAVVGGLGARLAFRVESLPRALAEELGDGFTVVDRHSGQAFHFDADRRLRSVELPAQERVEEPPTARADEPTEAAGDQQLPPEDPVPPEGTHLSHVDDGALSVPDAVTARAARKLRAMYADPTYFPKAQEFEARLGSFAFDHPRATRAARQSVSRLFDVLAAAFSDRDRNEVAAVFFKDDPTSSGQVGERDPALPALDDLLRHGNVRELMTAFFNATFFKDSPLTLKSLLGEIAEQRDWARAERLGLNVPALRRQASFLRGRTRRQVHAVLDTVAPGRASAFANDFFSIGNVVAQSGSWRQELAKYWGRVRRWRPEDERLAGDIARTRGERARLGIGLSERGAGVPGRQPGRVAGHGFPARAGAPGRSALRRSGRAVAGRGARGCRGAGSGGAPRDRAGRRAGPGHWHHPVRAGARRHGEPAGG